MTEQPDTKTRRRDSSSSMRLAAHPLEGPPSSGEAWKSWPGSRRAADLPGLEFPDPSIEVLDEPSRRDFLRFMAASLALGGIGGCAYQPTESIVPYVEAPEAIVPGKPLFFASAIPIDGYACGVLVKSHMGRPDQPRRQPRPSRQPGCRRHLRPGHDSDALRPRPLAVGHPQRPGRYLGALADAHP